MLFQIRNVSVFKPIEVKSERPRFGSQQFKALDENRKIDECFLLYSPGRKQVAEQLWAVMLSAVLDQCLSRLQLTPTSGQHPESLVQKHRDRRIGVSQLIVPRAEDDVFRDHVDGGGGSVHGCFPLSKVVRLSIDQAITPHEHLDMAFAHEVPVYVVDRLCKEHRRILSFARGRRVRAEQKNLIHAYVNGIGTEGVDQLVHQL